MMTLRSGPSAVLFVTSLMALSAAHGKDIYVAASGGNNQNSGASPSAPLATIAAASALAGPGDNVNLIAGQYNEAIVPVNSGTQGRPITYQSYGGQAVISKVNVGILVSSRAYLTFNGIGVNGTSPAPNATVNTFVAIQNSSNIVVRNGTFKFANGWAGIDVSGRYVPDGRYWQNYTSAAVDGTSSYITIEDNVVDNVGLYQKPSGNVIQVQYGTVQHVLVQRNTVTHGGHNLVEFDSDYGVLQDNVLNNFYGDLVGGDTGYRIMEVQGSYNVVQRNFMAHARMGGGGYVPPVAAVRGNQNIIRLNVMFDSIRSGIVTWCASSASTVTNGRIYNNTLDQLGGEGWSMWAYAGCDTLGGFVFANNLVANSRVNPGQVSSVTVWDADLVFVPVTPGSSQQPGATLQSLVKGNQFAPRTPGPAYVMLMGADGRIPLSAAAGKYTNLFVKNQEARAQFVGASLSAAADFQLSPGSPGHGTGVFLTQAVGAGTSNLLPVQYSLYFSDGNGVMLGDMIQLQGGTATAQIVSIDRKSNTLTLSSPVTFTNGQGIALPYSGSAPDVGAGQVSPAGIRPMPPGNVQLTH